MLILFVRTVHYKARQSVPSQQAQYICNILFVTVNLCSRLGTMVVSLYVQIYAWFVH